MTVEPPITACGDSPMDSGKVGFPILGGGVSYTIRILLYLDVSCVYPVEYMYPECILMYLKCILNALLHSKRIHVS